MASKTPEGGVSACGQYLQYFRTICSGCPLLYASFVAKTPNKLKAVRLPDEYIQGLERIATRDAESFSTVLRRAVRELIAREEKIGK